MAFYGVPSTGAALSASSGNDTVRLGPTQVILTSTTVYGLDGNDLIDLAAIGKSATFAVTATGLLIGSGVVAGKAIASSTYSFSTAFRTGTTGSMAPIATTGVVTTSQKAVRKLTDTNLYGNVGNDTIIFGESLTGLGSASLGGGAGDDIIGNYTNVGGTLTGGSDLSLTTSEGATLEGGAVTILFALMTALSPSSSLASMVAKARQRSLLAGGTLAPLSRWR